MPIKIIQEGTKVFVHARISSPFLGDEQILVRFLLDTGADVTTISPEDARTLGIDFGRLAKNYRRLLGVGGSMTDAFEVRDVEFVFTGTNGENICKTVDFISIMMPDPLPAYGPSSRMPSLMDRDVLVQLRFLFNSYPVLEDK